MKFYSMKMNSIGKLLLGAAHFAGLLSLACAQDVDPTAMLGGGTQVVQMVDQGKVGEIWDGATSAAKKRVSRSEFVRQVTESRASLAIPQQRTWTAVHRQTVVNEDADLAGQYVSVEYETRFSSAASRAVREMVSFHLERDGTWRFSGYVLR